MSFTLPQIPAESKFGQQLRLRVLEACYPRELVGELLTRCHGWEQRERKLSQLLIVYYVIALSLWRPLNVTAVFAHLSRGLRWLWPDDTIALPTGGALTARRQSLGITVLRLLFRTCCRPLATAQTRGAFAFGLRLMAVDSTLDEVPDTLANGQHFGRLSSSQSQSPFPQVRCLYLAELGTHAIIDAVLARCKASEQALCWALCAPSRLACSFSTTAIFSRPTGSRLSSSEEPTSWLGWRQASTRSAATPWPMAVTW
jgi:Insertion element 4 transposase N-terminal